MISPMPTKPIPSSAFHSPELTDIVTATRASHYSYMNGLRLWRQSGGGWQCGVVEANQVVWHEWPLELPDYLCKF